MDTFASLSNAVARILISFFGGTGNGLAKVSAFCADFGLRLRFGLSTGSNAFTTTFERPAAAPRFRCSRFTLPSIGGEGRCGSGFTGVT